MGRSEIRSSLSSILVPSGSAAKISSIVRHGTYKFFYAAPGAGALTIDWYHRSGSRRTLVASARTTAVKARRLVLEVKLTTAGRSALERARQLELIYVVTFKPRGHTAVSRSGRFALH
jgi:hypothetical protein